MKAVVAYQKRQNILTSLPKPMKLNKELKNKRKIIMRSFSVTKTLYATGRGKCLVKEAENEVGAKFSEVTNYVYKIIEIVTFMIFNYL